MPSTYNKKARSYNKKAHPPYFWGVRPPILTLLRGVKTTYNKYSLNSYIIGQNPQNFTCKKKLQ